MGIKLGIGGGVGPFRAGISTRGVGGGIGPLSAGTSWRRRPGGGSGGGCGALIGLLLVLAVILLAVEWPWLATRSIARSHHVSPHGQHVLAWIVEGFYLLLLLLIVVAVAAKTAAPVLVGLAPFTLALIVGACIHGHYDQTVAATQQAKSECTRALATDVRKAARLVEQLKAQYPKPASDAQWKADNPLFNALSNKQDHLDSSDPLYAALDAWTSHTGIGVDLVEGDPQKTGITTDMQALLDLCGVTP